MRPKEKLIQTETVIRNLISFKKQVIFLKWHFLSIESYDKVS